LKKIISVGRKTMIISDLNHLEVVDQETKVVGGFTQGGSAVIYFSEYFDLYKDVYSKAKVEGNIATSESDAFAYGKDTVTQTFTLTDVTPYSSFSSGTSISATE